MLIDAMTSFAGYLVLVKDGKPLSRIISVDTDTLEYIQVKVSGESWKLHREVTGTCDRLIISDRTPKHFLEQAREGGVEVVPEAEFQALRQVQNDVLVVDPAGRIYSRREHVPSRPEDVVPTRFGS
jgi:hypothetical protein